MPPARYAISSSLNTTAPVSAIATPQGMEHGTLEGSSSRQPAVHDGVPEKPGRFPMESGISTPAVEAGGSSSDGVLAPQVKAVLAS